jgi:hypothetical protein
VYRSKEECIEKNFISGDVFEGETDIDLETTFFD